MESSRLPFVGIAREGDGDFDEAAVKVYCQRAQNVILRYRRNAGAWTITRAVGLFFSCLNLVEFGRCLSHIEILQYSISTPSRLQIKDPGTKLI